jgi:hypothetical protein
VLASLQSYSDVQAIELLNLALETLNISWMSFGAETILAACRSDAWANTSTVSAMTRRRTKEHTMGTDSFRERITAAGMDGCFDRHLGELGFAGLQFGMGED